MSPCRENDMTRQEAQDILDDLNTAVAGVLEKHGMEKEKGHLSYDDTSVRFTLSARLLDSDGNRIADGAEEKALRSHFEYCLKAKNLPQKLIGARFTVPGRNGYFRITGYNGKARRYPVLFESETGREPFCGTGADFEFVR